MNGKPRLHFPIWAVLMAALLVALAAITVIILLIQRSDHSRQTEIALLKIEEKAIHISSLEWQAIARTGNEGSLDSGLVAEIESESEVIDAQFAELNDLQVDSSMLADIHILHDQYLEAVRQELGLLGAVRLHEANSLDQQQVDPAYQRLESAIASASDDSATSAQEATLLAYLGAVFTGISAALMIGLLFKRIDRQRIKVAASEAETNALSVTEKYFRSLVENSSDVVMILSDKGVIDYVSDSAKHVLLYKPEEILGNNLIDLVLPEDREIVEKYFDKCVKHEGTNLSTEFRFRYGDGSWGYLDATGNSRLNDATIGGIVINSRNITNRKLAEEELKNSENRLQSIFDSSRDAIMTLEPPSWNFTSGNPATVEMFGTGSEENLLNLGPSQLSPERQPDGSDSAEKSQEMIEIAMRKGHNLFDWTQRRVNGQEFPATVLLSRIELSGKTFLQATVRDITQLKQAEDALRSISLTDDLTGLNNHRGFKTLAEQQLLNAHRAAFPTQLLFIDLDDLKTINDTRGHKFGDRALVDLARVFSNTFRESDILGRIGGDEFVILASDTSLSQVNLLVERLNKNLEELNSKRKRDNDPLLNISLGIAECTPSETCILEEFLARADALMYEQKRLKKKERATGGAPS